MPMNKSTANGDHFDQLSARFKEYVGGLCEVLKSAKTEAAATLALEEETQQVEGVETLSSDLMLPGEQVSHCTPARPHAPLRRRTRSGHQPQRVHPQVAAYRTQLAELRSRREALFTEISALEKLRPDETMSHALMLEAAATLAKQQLQERLSVLGADHLREALAKEVLAKVRHLTARQAAGEDAAARIQRREHAIAQLELRSETGAAREVMHSAELRRMAEEATRQHETAHAEWISSRRAQGTEVSVTAKRAALNDKQRALVREQMRALSENVEARGQELAQRSMMVASIQKRAALDAAETFAGTHANAMVMHARMQTHQLQATRDLVKERESFMGAIVEVTKSRVGEQVGTGARSESMARLSDEIDRALHQPSEETQPAPLSPDADNTALMTLDEAAARCQHDHQSLDRSSYDTKLRSRDATKGHGHSSPKTVSGEATHGVAHGVAPPALGQSLTDQLSGEPGHIASVGMNAARQPLSPAKLVDAANTARVALPSSWQWHPRFEAGSLRLDSERGSWRQECGERVEAIEKEAHAQLAAAPPKPQMSDAVEARELQLSLTRAMHDAQRRELEEKVNADFLGDKQARVAALEAQFEADLAAKNLAWGEEEAEARRLTEQAEQEKESAASALVQHVARAQEAQPARLWRKALEQRTANLAKFAGRFQSGESESLMYEGAEARELQTQLAALSHLQRIVSEAGNPVKEAGRAPVEKETTGRKITTMTRTVAQRARGPGALGPR